MLVRLILWDVTHYHLTCGDSSGEKKTALHPVQGDQAVVFKTIWLVPTREEAPDYLACLRNAYERLSLPLAA